MTTITRWRVTRDGEPVSPLLPDENACHAWLLRHQPMSTDWAMKHEGYAFREETRPTELEIYAGRVMRDYPTPSGRGVYHHLWLSVRLETQDRDATTIDHHPIAAGYLRLSITHMEYRLKDRSDGGESGGAGAGPLTRLVDGPLRTKGRRIAKLAERWHLNGMRAGCAHQPDGEYGSVADCEVSGYRYGSAWLVEPLPDDVVAQAWELLAMTNDAEVPA